MNTVPAQVLDRAVLEHIRPDAVLLELASESVEAALRGEQLQPLLR